MNIAPITIEYKGYTITTDKTKMQPAAIHKWLSEQSYWCKHIPFETVKTAFEHSFCIAVLKDDVQIGYARFITDYARFAYLADVYVEEEHRGKGLSKKMMDILMGLDWVSKLQKLMLGTLDAHGLYKQYGFKEIAIPERFMEISRPDIYGDTKNVCS